MANILVDVGEAWIIDVLDAAISNQTSFTQYIHWGTGAGTAAKADTDLFTPASEARVSATRSQPAADTVQYVGTLTADAGKTITNAGVWTAITTGTLILHSDHASTVLATGEKIEYTFQMQQT